jgi:hypothetical protein
MATHNIHIKRPIFGVITENPVGSVVNSMQLHTVLILELENDEKWIMDVTGSQFGFSEVLAPLERYLEEKEGSLKNTPEPYDRTETSDLEDYSTIQAFTGAFGSRERLKSEFVARLHFAAFVKDQFEWKNEKVKVMLSGPEWEFENRVFEFVEKVEVHMGALVQVGPASLRLRSSCNNPAARLFYKRLQNLGVNKLSLRGRS